jgi:hypothetical protein
MDHRRATVAHWNEALNAGDTGTLRTLYAPSVLYYGTQLDGAKCVGRIVAALEKARGYHQDIEIKSVREDEEDAQRATVFFTKRTQAMQYDAYIVVDQSTSKILEESDATTDANLVKRGACFSYDSNVTLTGTLRAAMHLAGDEAVPGTSLDLDKEVCVIADVSIRFDDAGNELYDGPLQPPRLDRSFVHVILADSPTDISAAWIGKRVTVKGRFVGRAMRDFTDLHLSVETIGGPTMSRAR